MEKKTRRFVEFFSPGSFFGDSWSEETATMDPYHIEWPDNAYMFAFYEQDVVIDGDETFYGERRKVSPNYYHPDSVVESLPEVERNPHSTDMLIRNMKTNAFPCIVWSRWGNWPQPFYPEKDFVLVKDKGK